VTGVDKLIRGSVNDLTVDLVGPTSEVTVAANASCDIIVSGNGNGLSVVNSFESSKLILITLHEISQLVDQDTTVGGSDLGPDVLVRSIGSFDGSVDIFLGSAVNLANDLFSGGVDGLNERTVTGNELVVDEKLGVDYYGSE
jgi:hypothetical protein